MIIKAIGLLIWHGILLWGVIACCVVLGAVIGLREIGGGEK